VQTGRLHCVISITSETLKIAAPPPSSVIEKMLDVLRKSSMSSSVPDDGTKWQQHGITCSIGIEVKRLKLSGACRAKFEADCH